MRGWRAVWRVFSDGVRGWRAVWRVFSAGVRGSCKVGVVAPCLQVDVGSTSESSQAVVKNTRSLWGRVLLHDGVLHVSVGGNGVPLPLHGRV